MELNKCFDIPTVYDAPVLAAEGIRTFWFCFTLAPILHFALSKSTYSDISPLTLAPSVILPPDAGANSILPNAGANSTPLPAYLNRAMPPYWSTLAPIRQISSQ